MKSTAIGALLLAACSNPTGPAGNVLDGNMSASEAPKPSGWYKDGMDDDVDNYPTEKWCTTSASSGEAFANSADAVRICVDWVPGQKKFALPQISYTSPNEYKTQDLVGKSATIKLKMSIVGMGQGGLHRHYVWSPKAAPLMAFMARQKIVKLFGQQIDVSGAPWAAKHVYKEPANVVP